MPRKVFPAASFLGCQERREGGSSPTTLPREKQSRSFASGTAPSSPARSRAPREDGGKRRGDAALLSGERSQASQAAPGTAGEAFRYLTEASRRPNPGEQQQEQLRGEPSAKPERGSSGDRGKSPEKGGARDECEGELCRTGRTRRDLCSRALRKVPRAALSRHRGPAAADLPPF